MSQHDQNVANDTGAAVRADINSALGAIFGLSSGAAAPGTTIAYMLWADTTSGLLKQRNAANTGWLVRGTLAETFVLARSSNTILAAADFARAFICTSSFTQTLTAAATLGDGWFCSIRNDGTGAITIDPNGAETIDGAATIALTPGEGVVVFCNGTSFKTIGRAMNITGMAAEASVVSTDELPIYDVSEAANNKATVENVLAAVAATQAEQETGSATNRAVTPGRQQYHPSAAKYWAYVNGATNALDASYNVSSITDNGAGDFTVNLTTVFSSANHADFVTSRDDGPLLLGQALVTTTSASVVRTQLRTAGGVNTDPNHWSIAGFGDQ